MTTDLIPIKHTVSTDVENDFGLANLYASAGMVEMARSIREDCVKKVCKDNCIPLIGIYGRISNEIYNWEGLDWHLVAIKNCNLPVPIPVLQKMQLIEDQSRLKIAIPRGRTDPVLLYQMPFFNEKVFIELARWE